jgi:uncharacterized protein YhfF
MDERDVTKDDLQRRSGLTLAGVFAFGDSAALSDELLGFVARGGKRATVGALTELDASQDPFPEPGLCWGLLDGRGTGRFVMQTTEVRIGRLDSVDPAFAWDEGEYDRTYESWLEGHRRYFARQGIDDPDTLEVAFERFRVVWPTEDAVTWLADGVREARIADRAWTATSLQRRVGPRADDRSHGDRPDPTTLPALVAERHGAPVGLLTFRPRPGGVVQVVSIDATDADGHITVALQTAMRRLADQEGWSTVRW